MNKTRTTIIAEAGVNHNGDLDLAEKLIDAAAEAEVDYVKFQTFKASKLVTATAVKAKYQQNASENETQHEMLTKLELDRFAHERLIKYCQRRGVRFLSTAFDLESIDLLVELGIDIFKIPSGELTNLPYLRKIAETRLPLVLSTGMANLAEVEAAIDALECASVIRENITVLHCNTEYPTPMGDVNLRAMNSMGEAFKVPIGYSDHTLGVEVPIAAVARGATMIEKHFTLSREMEGPDHAASLEPEELKLMVKSIRNIEQALGDGVKRPSSSEAPNKLVARKSIVAMRAIREGETITDDMLTVKRPGDGISPMCWDELIGRVAKRDFKADEAIEL